MEKISKEELRAILTAACSVMEYHNHNLYENVNKIDVYIKEGRYLEKKENGKNVIGRAFYKGRKIVLASKLPFQKALTTSIHEIIHLYKRFDKNEIEKCTSTLCSKIKPDIAKLYEILVENTHERAAYFAHTKITYKPEEHDYYDEKEHDHVDVIEKGKKYREKGG